MSLSVFRVRTGLQVFVALLGTFQVLTLLVYTAEAVAVFRFAFFLIYLETILCDTVFSESLSGHACMTHGAHFFVNAPLSTDGFYFSANFLLAAEAMWTHHIILSPPVDSSGDICL